MMTRTELRAALCNPNVRALLMVIRAGLGTAEANGYRSLFGGGEFEDVRWHPTRRITIQVGGRTVTSTEAGAYRVLSKVWEGLVDRYGFEDFGATCQDEAAVARIALCGALPDLLDGRFALAVDRCAVEWSCLPGSPHGGPDEPQVEVLTMDRAREIYHRHGGRMGPAPAELCAQEKPADDAQARLTSDGETQAAQRRGAGRLRPLMVGLAVAALLMAWVLRAKGAWP